METPPPLKPVLVRYRTVSISVFPWSPRPGVTYWKFHHGGKTPVRSTLEKAKAEAKRIAEETYLGTARLGNLTAPQAAAIRRMIQADPTLSSVDEFIAWQKRRRPDKPCREAVTEFLKAVEKAAGASRRNLTTLKGHLALLPDIPLGQIRTADLPPLEGSPRSQENRRRAWTTFFRWCVDMEYLPHGEKTAPERLKRPRVVSSIPTTLTPDELRILFQHVSAEYLPWLALSAFAGLRNSELCPVSSDKPPLDWSDIHWDREIIILRPETSKTGRRRVIPILPALSAWLRPIARPAGRICPERNPSHGIGKRVQSETSRLGGHIGGWKPNALRHSFISYRAAIVGIAQAAQEAGNSESISRRAYQDAKAPACAEEWFKVIPEKYPRKTVVQQSPHTESLEKPLKFGT